MTATEPEERGYLSAAQSINPASVCVGAPAATTGAALLRCQYRGPRPEIPSSDRTSATAGRASSSHLARLGASLRGGVNRTRIAPQWLWPQTMAGLQRSRRGGSAHS